MTPTTDRASGQTHDLVFVGGHSRSGTTLLQGLICNSPDSIPMTRECSYLRSLVGAHHLGRQWWDAHTHDYFDDLAAFDAFNRRVLDAWFDTVAERHGPGTIVQKEPRLTQFFPDLAALYPTARFVVILRDFRDVLASQARRARRGQHKFDPNADLTRFVSTFERLRANASLFGRRLVYVRYESLVLDPAAVLAELYPELGLSAPEPLVGTWQTKRTAREESGSELDGRAPEASAIGRYRTDLDPSVLSQVDKLRAQITRKIGYDCFCADDIATGGDWAGLGTPTTADAA